MPWLLSCETARGSRAKRRIMDTQPRRRITARARQRASKVHRGDITVTTYDGLPRFITADEVAALLLRTTRKAVYVMVERGQLPGVTRIGRRILFRTDV